MYNTNFEVDGRKGVNVSLSNLSICINKSKKLIIHPINVNISGGSLFCILGGSGSGKTTLLNVIAGRYSKSSITVDGSIAFGHRECAGVGFVAQSDYLMPCLTVRETLQFIAGLQIPPIYHDKSRDQIVDDIILDLGLKECADTRVSTISGGQKRRVSIAIQIISDPEVLCADEPTSGLDSFTASTVMETLQNLTMNTHRRTTIICSIHQPRADLFRMFDSMLLLSRGGKTAYCGKIANLVSYFSRYEMHCPLHSNPADFFVDLVSIDPRSEETARIDRVRVKFIEDEAEKNFHIISQTQLSGTETESLNVSASNHHIINKYHLNWFMQVLVLTKRFYVNSYRNMMLFYGSIFQASCLGLVVMGIFYQLDESNAAIQSRFGLMYIFLSCENYILSVILVERLSSEIRVLDRELQDYLYAPSAYFFGYMLCSFPQLTLQGLAFAIPIYFGATLRNSAVSIINFMAVGVGTAFVIHGLAWMSVAASRIYAVSSMIANMSFTFISITAGFLINSNSIPVYLSWIKYTSYLYYGYKILMSGEFAGRTFINCDSSGCTTVDGDSILSSQDIPSNDYQGTWPYIIIIGVVYHSIALIFLYILRYPPTGTVGGNEEVISYMEDEVDPVAVISFQAPDMTVSHSSKLLDTFAPPPQVTVSVVDLTISVLVASAASAQSNAIAFASDNIMSSPSSIPAHPLRNQLLSTRMIGSTYDINDQQDNTSMIFRKKLLCNVNATISPGRLVALMGGSGSGKTTLLNALAGRISFINPIHTESNSISSQCGDHLSKMIMSMSASNRSYQYSKTGSILFNLQAFESNQLQNVVGYVQQSDFHLPSLTVRETLQFHADLRLSRSIIRSDKRARVMHVAQLLGLNDCLDVRVGSDDLKGISGGEKRRLSVGVQMLLDPSVCLLDEPTTGLDTFTARHVVETLGDIARAGRTVILSIHQPRYDVFACLDDVILLARGSQLWSGSATDMMKHFEALGYPCPTLSNPADYILDISSIDFRSEEKEKESRSRLMLLVDAFETRNTDTDHEMKDNDAANITNASSISSILDVNVHDRQNLRPKHVSLIYSLQLMMSRSYRNQIRQPIVISTRISQNLFFALILSAFYAPVLNNQASVQNRLGNIYELTALTFIGMLNCIAVYPTERDVFYREYVDGGFSVTAFFLTYFIFALPFLFVSAGGLSALMTFAIGLGPDGESYGIFVFTVFWFMFVGECIGVAFCSSLQQVGIAANITSLVISVFCMMSGNLSVSMSVVLTTINYISPLRYGVWLMNNVIFRGQVFTCTQEEISDGACRFTTGEQVLELYDMSVNGDEDKYRSQQRLYMVVLVIISIGFMILSYFALVKRVSTLTN